MAFVCTCNGNSVRVDKFHEGEEYSVHVHVGYDDAENKNYSIVAGLSPAPPGDLEYYFFLVEVDGDANSEQEYRDGRKIAEFISKEDRRSILMALLTATKALVDFANPQVFTMATHGAYLPQRAIDKYHALNQLFMSCGYNVMETNAYHGTRSWWMERVCESTVVLAEQDSYDPHVDGGTNGTPQEARSRQAD